MKIWIQFLCIVVIIFLVTGIYGARFSKNRKNHEKIEKFPALFYGVPENYHKVILKYAKKEFGKNLANYYKMTDEKRKAFPWEVIGKYFGFDVFYLSGYLIFLNEKLLRGRRNSFDGVDLKNILFNNHDQKISFEELVQEYKIHLMPADDIMVTVLLRIINALQTDSELSQLTSAFKLQLIDDAEILKCYKQGKPVFPKIVIYPQSGKESAQKVLTKLYYVFKDIKGLNIIPRYNQPITSLIYVAQGDGDYKSDYWVEKMKQKIGMSPYEEPKRIYYRSNITGQKVDYYLYKPNFQKKRNYKIR